MFLSSRHELIVLLGTFAGGVVLGIVFDFFRIMRKNFEGAKSVVWLQDMLMWAVMLVVVYSTIFITNDGKIRWYQFAGFGVGIVIYMVALSKFVIGVSTWIIDFTKRIIRVVVKLISLPVKLLWKILGKPINIMVCCLKKMFRRAFGRQKQNFIRFLRVFRKI